MAKVAAVTGASSGIGAEFCRALDAEDLDEIWMISRRADAMEGIASGIRTKCRIIPIDLSDENGRDRLATKIQTEKPDIRYAIGCAGLGRFGDSFSIPKEQTRSMIEVNISSTVEFVSMCIPFMGRGSHIIVLCSEAAYVAAYRLGVYAASKAFVRSYLDSLRYEVENKGISVLEVSPGWVDTPFIDGARSSFDAPPKVFGGTVTKEAVVKKAMEDCASGRKRSVCGFATRTIISLATHFPRFSSYYWRRLWKRWDRFAPSIRGRNEASRVNSYPPLRTGCCIA